MRDYRRNVHALLSILATVSLAGFAGRPVAAQTPPDEKCERTGRHVPWTCTVTDDSIIEAARTAVGNLPETFVPDLDDYPPEARKRVRDGSIEVDRRPLSFGKDRGLLAVLRGPGIPATAATNCELVVALERESGEPRVAAHHTLCSGGRTERTLSQADLRLNAGTPVIVTRRRTSAPAGPRAGEHLVYNFYRVDDNGFDEVLSFRISRGTNHHESDSVRCSRPRFHNISVTDGPHRDIVASVVCHDEDFERENYLDATRTYTRVWEWTGNSYRELSTTSPDTYPPQLGGSSEDETDDSSEGSGE